MELTRCREALEELVCSDSAAYAKRAKRMLKQVEYYDHKVDKQTTRYRCLDSHERL